jgi:CRISPR-associated helicase Cas3
MQVRASVFETILEVVGSFCGIEDASKALKRLSGKVECLDGAHLLALSGYVIVADWLASNQSLFPLYSQEYKPDYVLKAQAQAQRALKTIGWHQVNVDLPSDTDWFKNQFGFQPNSLQQEVLRVVSGCKEPALIIIEAPMGLGKTEAALSAAEVLMASQGLKGVFVGLPTQATSNNMFRRTKSWLQNLGPGTYVLQLAHGKAQQIEEYRDIIVHGRPVCVEQDSIGDSEATVVAEDWFSGPKKRLLAPFVVGTIDQALISVAKVKHVSLRKVGLSGKVVIFDEIHAYDAYMSVFIERVLEWLAVEQIPVILLSATLPPPIRSRLAKAYVGRDVEMEVSYPAVTAISRKGSVRSVGETIEVRRQSVDLELLAVSDPTDPSLTDRIAAMATAGANVLVVLNTVDRAQRLYRELCTSLSSALVELIHARFCAGDRLEKEKRLASQFGRGATRPKGHVVIGTQVLEQSLDLDFDVLVSDIAPIDLILQRLGRVHRHSGIERPSDFKQPRATIIGWTGDPPEFPKALCNVYGEYLLLQSLAILKDRKTIELPEDIPGLVKVVYGGDVAAPTNWKERILSAKERWDDDELKRRRHAEQFVIPPPSEVKELTDLSRLGINGKDDDDPEVQGAIRGASPTIELATGFRQPSGNVKFQDVELAMDRQPSDEEIDAILSSLVRLPSKLTSTALKEAKVPACWEHHPWLRKQRALFFDAEGKTQLGEFNLHYDKNVGLEVQHGGS